MELSACTWQHFMEWLCHHLCIYFPILLWRTGLLNWPWFLAVTHSSYDCIYCSHGTFGTLSPGCTLKGTVRALSAFSVQDNDCFVKMAEADETPSYQLTPSFTRTSNRWTVSLLLGRKAVSPCELTVVWLPVGLSTFSCCHSWVLFCRMTVYTAFACISIGFSFSYWFIAAFSISWTLSLCQSHGGSDLLPAYGFFISLQHLVTDSCRSLLYSWT